MKKARRNGFIKITAILLACIVSVGMLPMSYGTSSADAADSDDYVSGSDLKATLYTYDGDTPVYYHSDWTQGEIYVEVEGETDKEVTGAFYKKNGDSDWTSANVNVTPIEAEPSTEPQPTEEPTETATVSSSESGRTADEESAVQEEVGEPEDQEPAPAEITGYKVASDFWVTEPNGTYEGTYDFKCEYSDGTDTAYTNFFTVRIDNYFDKLEASLDKGGDGWSHKAVFSGSVSDKGSGIDKVWYSYGDNEVEIAPDDKGDFKFEISEDFKGSVEIKAVDKAGNKANLAPVDVKIDKTAPEITELKVPKDGWTNESVNVTGKAEDALSGVENVYYILVDEDTDMSKISESDAKKADYKDGAFSFKIDAGEVKNFSGSAVVFAKDNAGNSSFSESSLKAVSVKIDTQKCVITELSVTPDDWTNGEVSVKGKITDNASGVDKDSVKYRYYLSRKAKTDKGEFKKVEDVEIKDGVALFEVKLNEDGKLKDGTYCVELTAADIAGNGAEVDAGSVKYPLIAKIQNTAPVIQKDVKVDYGSAVTGEKLYTNKPVTITCTVADSNSGLDKSDSVFLKKSGDESDEWHSAAYHTSYGNTVHAFKLEIPAQDYTGTYLIKAKNKAGAETDGTFETPVLYMDGSAPVFDEKTITFEPSDWASSTVVSGKVSDVGDSGIKSVFYRFAGEKEWIKISDVKLSDDKKTADFSFELKNVEYNGKLEFMCEDNAGAATGGEGNKGYATPDAKVYLDIVAPVVKGIDTEYKGDWTKADFVINGEAADDLGNVNSGVKNVLCVFRSSDEEIMRKYVEVKDGKFDATVNVKDFDEAGGFRGDLYLYAIDKANNITENPYVVALCIDTLKGDAKILSYDKAWSSGDVEVKVTFVDKKIASGFGSVSYFVEGGEEIPFADDCVTKGEEENTLMLKFTKDNRKERYFLRFRDKAGNVTDGKNLYVDISQDTQPPEMTELTVKPAGRWTNSPIRLSGTAEDNKTGKPEANSGISRVEYKKSTDESWTQVSSLTFHSNKRKATFSFELPDENYEGTYDFRCFDKADNVSATVTTELIQYDSKAPRFSEDGIKASTTSWSNEDVTLSGTVLDNDDPQFNSGLKAIRYRKEGDKFWTSLSNDNISFDEEKKEWNFTAKIKAQCFKGLYEFECEDKAGNISTIAKSPVIRLDNAEPEITVEHNESFVRKIASAVDYITFFAFRLTDHIDNRLVYTINIKDTDSGVDIDTLQMKYTENDVERVIPIKDGEEALADVSIETITTTAEGEIEEAKVSFKFKDEFKGQPVFAVNDKVGNGNSADGYKKNETILVDNTDPTRKVTYPAPVSIVRKEQNAGNEEYNDETVTSDDILYYNSESVDLGLQITEKNFYAEDINKKTDKTPYPECSLIVTKDGKPYEIKNPEWNKNAEAEDTYDATLSLTEVGEYVVNLKYQDSSFNTMKEFTSAKIVIYRTPPEIEVKYDKNVKAENVVDGRTYYKGAQTATVRVKEKYFYPEDATIEVEAKAFKLNDDLTAEPIEVTDAYTISEWQEDPEDPLYHFATVEFNADANYEIKVNYTDKCKYSDDYENKLTVDTTVPKLVKTEIDKPLSQLILSGLTLGFYKANVNVTLTYFDAVAGVCTFESEGAKAEGKYISEINSQFEKQTLDVTSEKGITVVSFTLLEKAAEEITDADNFDSLINAHVTDRSNNTTEKETVSKNTKEDGSGVVQHYDFILDNKNPDAKITLKNSFNEKNNVRYTNEDINGEIEIDEANFHKEFLSRDLSLKITEDDLKNTSYFYNFGEWSSDKDVRKNNFIISEEGRYAYNFNYADPSGNKANELTNSMPLVIDKTEPKGSVSRPAANNVYKGYEYYNTDFTLTFEIEEHNFDAPLVKFLADGTEETLEWTAIAKDKYKATYTFSAQGVHSYSLNSTDLAGNEMEAIEEGNLVIDKEDPELSIKYSFDYDRSSGRTYLDHTCTAVVTVKELNFWEEQTNIDITALNVANSGDGLGNAAVQGEWEHDGIYHTKKISFNGDANFTVTATCLDLATNSIAPYGDDEFTVDTVKPGDIQFTFSDPIDTKTVSGTEFRYYNQQIKVDISCYDETSGVDHFDYEGILGSGVSSVNSEVVKTALEGAEITQNGTSFTASFYIPKSALTNSTQFNGTVTVGAKDRSGNTNETANTTRLVADNITPEGRVEPSAAVRTAESKDFYSGDITLTLTITEANFYSEDVDFKVDGAAVSVNWNDSGDTHTATYVISGEAEHNYTLNYKDRSNNAMTEVKNERPLVIDKTKPSITIDKSLRNKTANNAETITFILTVSDKYFDTSGISPKLITNKVVSGDKEKTVDSKEIIGHLEKVEIPLGNPVRSGESYIYTIDNLDADGYYQFTCEAKDYAGNTSKEIKCTGSDDSSETVERFDFSVNRYGSAFWIETENAENDGYTNSEAIMVALHEVNVDKTVEGSALKVVDDNDTKTIELNSTNYQGNVSRDGDWGWYESTYTLDNSYFARDSKYTVVLTTRDQAGNINISSEDDLSVISFIVDRTAPIISSNVSSDQIIKSNGYEIEARITEENLDNDTIEVTIDNAPVDFEQDGSLVKFHFDNGTHEIKINAGDLANNAADEYTVYNLTVSDNPIVLWFANKPLFFATTGGALALIALIVFLLVRRSKKKAQQ